MVEKAEGASGSRGHSAVYGITNWDQVNSTLAMFVVWNEGESITGWVGGLMALFGNHLYVICPVN